MKNEKYIIYDTSNYYIKCLNNGLVNMLGFDQKNIINTLHKLSKIIYLYTRKYINNIKKKNMYYEGHINVNIWLRFIQTLLMKEIIIRQTNITNGQKNNDNVYKLLKNFIKQTHKKIKKTYKEHIKMLGKLKNVINKLS